MLAQFSYSADVRSRVEEDAHIRQQFLEHLLRQHIFDDDCTVSPQNSHDIIDFGRRRNMCNFGKWFLNCLGHRVSLPPCDVSRPRALKPDLSLARRTRRGASSFTLSDPAFLTQLNIVQRTSDKALL